MIRGTRTGRIEAKVVVEEGPALPVHDSTSTKSDATAKSVPPELPVDPDGVLAPNRSWVDRHRKSERTAIIKHLCIAFGAQPCDASECAEHALQLLTAAMSFVPQKRAWLRAEASRLFLSGAFATDKYVPDGTLLLDMSQGLSPEKSIVVQDRVQTLAKGIHALPPRQRQVIAWCFGEFDVDEAAEHLGWTEADVRKELQAARRALGGFMKKQGYVQ